MALRPHPFDQDQAAFERALRETGEPTREPDAEGPTWPKLHLPGDISPSRGGGGEARWHMAMVWAEEVEKPTDLRAQAKAPEPAPAGDCESISRELGLDLGLSAEELSCRRRAFLWRNHPDRLPADMREKAHARVAVANALYDRARHERGGSR